MTISHDSDFSFSLTDNSMVSDFITDNNSTIIIVVLPEDKNIMSFEGDFEIDELLVVNSYEQIDIMLPSRIELGNAYPNPFNPITSLNLYMTQEGYVSVKVYDVVGQLVGVILEGDLDHGNHSLNWNAAHLPSGLYFIMAESNYNISTQKVTLLK